MKAVYILGSPNEYGNTNAICSEILKAFSEDDFTIKKYCLSNISMNYCCGCKSCYTDGKCIHNDDVQRIIEDIYSSDIVILASPSYWGDVTGQMKIFIDRCTPYCNTNTAKIPILSSVKGVAVAIRAGQNKKENENLLHTFEHFLGHLEIPLISCFTAEGINTSQDLSNNSEMLNSAYDFGKSVVSNLRK